MSDLPGAESGKTDELAPRDREEVDERRPMSASEVAQHLGISPVTVRLWCRDGRVAGAVREGRQWLVSLAEVRAMLAAEPTLGHPRGRDHAPQRRDWRDAPDEVSMDFADLARTQR